VPEPKWRKRNKHRVLDLGGRKNTIARGARIRQKVVAQQHLQTSLTITLEDGSTTRVWLAAGKDGKKIIGDSAQDGGDTGRGGSPNADPRPEHARRAARRRLPARVR
jgi:hypothetical protein